MVVSTTLFFQNIINKHSKYWSMVQNKSLDIVQDKALDIETLNHFPFVQRRVVMLGGSLQIKGGIAAVQKLILQNVPSQVQIQHIATIHAHMEDGSTARKVLVFGKALGKLLWKLSRKEADLIHIHFSQRGSTLRKMILMVVALAFRIPVVLHAHGSEYHLFYAGLPQWVKRVEGLLFRQSTYFIVLSQSWKDFYTSIFGLKARQVVVLPNPIKFPLKVPHRTSCNKVILVFFGRISQRKGAFDLIRAFATLPAKQKTRSELILAGDGDVEQARSLVESLNLMAHITVPGWVDSEQRDAILAKANVFVLPSYNEGLPMAVLEAMGWGLPVLTTPVGGIPEFVVHGENGLLVKPGEIQELSMAMQALINDEALRLSLGSAARARVAPLNVEDYCSSLLDIYSSVQESKGVAL